MSKTSTAATRSNLITAEHIWFLLRLWTVHHPFIAAMTTEERTHLRRLCRDMANALDLILGKE